jgi:hypothetical protein
MPAVFHAIFAKKPLPSGAFHVIGSLWKALLWRRESAVQGGLSVFLISVSVTTRLDMNGIFRGNVSR